MRKEQSKLAGFAHLLRPDPKRVESDAAWNGHLDTICEAVQGLKVEQDSNAAAEPQPELPIEEKPKRKAKSKPNRMHEGGEDRDDAA